MTAQELKEYRLMLGISQASLAAAIGVAEVDIIKMENGKTTIPANLEQKAHRFITSGGRK